jgi:hypothetical protein
MEIDKLIKVILSPQKVNRVCFQEIAAFLLLQGHPSVLIAFAQHHISDGLLENGEDGLLEVVHVIQE